MYVVNATFCLYVYMHTHPHPPTHTQIYIYIFALLIHCQRIFLPQQMETNPQPKKIQRVREAETLRPKQDVSIIFLPSGFRESFGRDSRKSIRKNGLVNKCIHRDCSRFQKGYTRWHPRAKRRRNTPHL